ncbi:hypothetical protein JCM3765_000777 [Sporobolomyces pararoseus]
MSSFYLPNELLESIFDFVHDKTAESTRLSQNTFASLALTSKRFLLVARSHLYYRPIFSINYAVTWDKAIRLATSLSSSSLGQLVISLEGIVDFVSRIGELDEPATSLPFQLRGYTKTFSIYYKLLASCPNLVSVELIFNSKQHLSKLLQALKPSLSTLKTVSFKNSIHSTQYRTSVDLVQAALRRAEMENVENLVIARVSNIDSGEPSTTLTLKSFEYRDYEGLFFSSKTFFPINTTSLNSFKTELLGIGQQSLNWIFNYLPSTIKQISISTIEGYRHSVPALDDYQTTTVCSIPLSALSRFTSLRQLVAKGLNGPSLAHLEALATSSPNLAQLDFSHSRWIRSPTSTFSPVLNGSSISFLADPDDLLLRLEKLKKLHFVDLGWLPTSNEDTYKNLEEELEARGIEVEWDVCVRYPICTVCGNRHSH